MLSTRNTLVLICGILIFSSKAQKVTVGMNRLLYSAHSLYPEDSRPKDVGEIFGGLAWNEQTYLLLLNLAYSKREPTYPGYYAAFLEEDNFFQESWSVGISGRWYILPNDLKIYFEPGIYLNDLHIREPLVIQHHYGVYNRIIDNREILWSAHFSIGAVWRINSHWEIGCHVQYGWIEPISDSRFGHRVLVASNHYFKDRSAILLSPLTLRYTF